MAAAERKRQKGRTRSKAKKPTPKPPMIAVEEKGGVYRLTDPQLEITVRNRNLEAGYAKMTELRAMVIDKLEESGLPLPGEKSAFSTSPIERSPWRPPRMMTIVAGVTVLILVYALAVAPLLRGVEAASNSLARLKEATKAENVARTGSRSLAAFAEALKRITPSRREEVLRNLRTVAEELRPYMVELAPMLEPLAIEKGKQPDNASRAGRMESQ